MKTKVKSVIGVLLVGSVFMFGCKDDGFPEPENEGEVITDVVLKFTNTTNSNDTVIARAQDPDGTGIQELTILDTIILDTSKTYTLTLDLLNALDPTDVESITEEVNEEGVDHKFFFSFSNNAFANPLGDGNFDNAADALNYNDLDVKSNGIGLSTTWTTNNVLLSNGSFQIRLQHQPDIKTANSTVNDGDTDIDLTFVLNIK